MPLTDELVEDQTAALYSVCNCQIKLLSLHHNSSSLLYLHIMPALSLSITHAHTHLQDQTGHQVIKQLSGGSVCGVTSRSRFDRQEFCGSGVMSRVQVLAARVDLHGNTSLSSSQRVCLSSFLSSLSLSPSPPLPPLPHLLSSLANSKQDKPGTR